MRLARGDLAAKPESFLVTKDNHLKVGEEDRAWEWGRQLAGHRAGKVPAAGRYLRAAGLS